MNRMHNMLSLKAALLCFVGSLTMNVACEVELNQWSYNIGAGDSLLEYNSTMGPKIDPVRQEIYRKVVQPTLWVKSKAKAEFEKEGTTQEVELKKAIVLENNFGGTCKEVLTPAVKGEMGRLILKLNQDPQPFLNFFDKHSEEHLYPLLKGKNPFLGLEQDIKQTLNLNLPTLESTRQIEAGTCERAQKSLMQEIFVPDVLKYASQEKLLNKTNEAYKKLPENILTKIFKQPADKKELEIFNSSVGLMVFYSLYQMGDLHSYIAHRDDKKSDNYGALSKIYALLGYSQTQHEYECKQIIKLNNAKKAYEETVIGNPTLKAAFIANQCRENNVAVLGAQEVSHEAREALEKAGYLPVAAQMQGTKQDALVFLDGAVFEGYQPIDFSKDYPKKEFVEGKLKGILTKVKGSGRLRMICSAHASSARFEDALLQVKIMAETLARFERDLGCEIDFSCHMDANTDIKSDGTNQLALFRQALAQYGFEDVDPCDNATTVKERWYSVQHDKLFKRVAVKKDWLIVKKGRTAVKNVRIGSKGQLDKNTPLPLVTDPCDHARLEATLTDC